MLKNYAESGVVHGGGQEEHIIKLGREQYDSLAAHRLEITSRVSAHIVWDSDNSTLILLGCEETAQQSALVLSQYLPRKVVGRGLPSHPPPDPHQQPAHKALLLTSPLPPELTISCPDTRLSHTSLGRTLSDSHTKLARRKLESEDSSYDSEGELAGGGGELRAQLSRSHDDVSRTYSETLLAESMEYVSISSRVDTVQTGAASSLDNLHLHSVGNSREASPVLAGHALTRLAEEAGVTSHPEYQSKVEKALKLGYPEELTRRALEKVGLSGCQDELLNELIRLQKSKLDDPKEVSLKQSCELATVSHPTPSPVQAASLPVKQSQGLLAEREQLRPIVIDGSNVAMAHGNDETFSCRGIEICVNYFRERGHTDIQVFVPAWRKERQKHDNHIQEQQLLEELKAEGVLKFTPSSSIGGRRIVPHDDRYILNVAAEKGAVVVSNDNFRELINDKPEYKKVIEERILLYMFSDDRFRPPDDPLGRNGPSLDRFLRWPSALPDQAQPCPYGKKCTYGNKCKYYHADRGTTPHKSVTEQLRVESAKQIQEARTRAASRDSSPGERGRHAINLRRTESDLPGRKQQLLRTRSSRPAPTAEAQHYQRLSKSEVSKSKSMDSRFPRDLRMSSVPMVQSDLGLEQLGCLTNYGQLAGPPPAWSPLHPPPPLQQHRKLERQLTINPSYDPRINKPEPEPRWVLPEAMEYMHRHPPPPLGLVQISEQEPHQSVTRNASAPDSIRQWGRECGPGPVVLPAVEYGAASPRNTSTSDSQLTRAVSSDPFSSSDTWKYTVTGAGTEAPWGGWASASPPVSPARNLGPVGSARPARLRDDLCNIFPTEQVDAVIALLPGETDKKVLCRKILDIFPPK